MKNRKRVAVGLSGDPPSHKAMEGKGGIRVAVGLSGGVDSAVAAAMLKEQGYEVTGVHLECWYEPGCRAPQDRKDALAVAMKLGIPFEVLDFRKAYKEKVLEYFYREYEAGRTPNPDVMCNLEIKFGLFLKWALKQGFDYVATGHYARIKEVRPLMGGRTSTYQLLRGVDKKKDQTYFLYRLGLGQLKHVLFPIGEMTKQQVRAEAKKRKIHVWNKKDSVGICFIGDINVQEFLKKRIKEKRGVVVMKRSLPALTASDRLLIQPFSEPKAKKGNKREGKIVSRLSKMDQDAKDDEYIVVGSHKGVWFYTVGQRGGFEISANARRSVFKNGVPVLYVMSKDVERNLLIVGKEREARRDQFYVSEVNWIGKIRNPKSEIRNLRVRIRHGGELIPAKLETYSKSIYLNKYINRLEGRQNSKEIVNKNYIVKLMKPQRGIAPGQSAVFYLPTQTSEGDECLGGGVIE